MGQLPILDINFLMFNDEIIVKDAKVVSEKKYECVKNMERLVL